MDDFVESDTLFPVRCITCGNILGRYRDIYYILLGMGKSKSEALDLLGMDSPRYMCCRMSLLNIPVIRSGSTYWNSSKIREEFESYSKKDIKTSKAELPSMPSMHSKKRGFIVEKQKEEEKKEDISLKSATKTYSAI